MKYTTEQHNAYGQLASDPLDVYTYTKYDIPLILAEMAETEDPNYALYLQTIIDRLQ